MMAILAIHPLELIAGHFIPEFHITDFGLKRRPLSPPFAVRGK